MYQLMDEQQKYVQEFDAKLEHRRNSGLYSQIEGMEACLVQIEEMQQWLAHNIQDDAGKIYNLKHNLDNTGDTFEWETKSTKASDSKLNTHLKSVAIKASQVENAVGGVGVYKAKIHSKVYE